MVDKMLNDDELNKQFKHSLWRKNLKSLVLGGLEMKPRNFNENSALKYDFNSK